MESMHTAKFLVFINYFFSHDRILNNKTISFILYAVRGTMDNRFLAMSIVASVGTGMVRGAANDEASF